MKRILIPFLSLLFLAAVMAPSIVLLQFELDRARIERELCVQRELMEGMRTCHGECQLSKRLNSLEQEAEAGFPTERVQVKYEPITDLAPAKSEFIVAMTELIAADPLVFLSDGHSHGVEHVPRV